MNPQAAIKRFDVLTRFPIIGGPMKDGWSHQLDAQDFPGRQRAQLVVEPPRQARRNRFFLQMALHGLRRLVEKPSVA